MKNLNFAAELHLKLGAPASGTVESLRLVRAFLKLAPRQRFEVIKLVEDLATEEARPDRPLSRARPRALGLFLRFPAQPQTAGVVYPGASRWKVVGQVWYSAKKK